MHKVAMMLIKNFGRLYEYIQTYDEPTIIVFYGDHLPHLYQDNKDILLDCSSYFNTNDDLLNTYRKYNTQALILANFDLGENEYFDYMSPDMLLTSIVNKMDINISNYYIWLYNNKNILPSTNYLVSQDVNGNLFWTYNLDEEKKNFLELRRKIQYRMLIDD